MVTFKNQRLEFLTLNNQIWQQGPYQEMSADHSNLSFQYTQLSPIYHHCCPLSYTWLSSCIYVTYLTTWFRTPGVMRSKRTEQAWGDKLNNGKVLAYRYTDSYC